jgi:small subunit ribosomal protein S4
MVAGREKNGEYKECIVFTRYACRVTRYLKELTNKCEVKRMGRYLEAKCKLCRREGMKLFLKGPKCIAEKCPFTKRPYAPGFHGKGTGRQKKASYYSQQLREKQKVKRMYGMLEKQFRIYYTIAAKTKGATGRKLIELLERRLDNVIFRALFALSRTEARQMVKHGFVFVNGRRVDIPSYHVKENDEILVKAINRSTPTLLDVDTETLKLKVSRLPEKEDLILPVNEQLIVELYSK